MRRAPDECDHRHRDHPGESSDPRARAPLAAPGVTVQPGDQITASVGVTSELIRGDIYFWGELMAGAVLGSVPIVILYVFFLDYYVSGLTAGAIK